MPESQRRSAIEKKSPFLLSNAQSMLPFSPAALSALPLPRELSLPDAQLESIDFSLPPTPSEQHVKRRRKRTTRAGRATGASGAAGATGASGVAHMGATGEEDLAEDADSESEDVEEEQFAPPQIIHNGTDAASIASILKSLQYFLLSISSSLRFLTSFHSSSY